MRGLPVSQGIALGRVCSIGVENKQCSGMHADIQRL